MAEERLCNSTTVLPFGGALGILCHPVLGWHGQLRWAGWFSSYTGYCKLCWTNGATPNNFCACLTITRCHRGNDSNGGGWSSSDDGWTLPGRHVRPLLCPWGPVFTASCDGRNCCHVSTFTRPWRPWGLLRCHITFCQATAGRRLVGRTRPWPSHLDSVVLKPL